ncbi:MAG: GNAT family N-acetyltransferase [Desulfarculaceae bacterium]|jgi:GNAT superfamily N-acetyltransferase
MELGFTSPLQQERGTIARVLNQSYAGLVQAEPDLWEPEKKNWEEFDQEVFDSPQTVGACTFLSWCGQDIAGLFSFDPRLRPTYGVIGHNCILPEYRNQGFGKQQIAEILAHFRRLGISQARVSTNDHPFFVPAQRMYTACGFTQIKRLPWDRDPRLNMIHYQKAL